MKIKKKTVKVSEQKFCAKKKVVLHFCERCNRKLDFDDCFEVSFGRVNCINHEPEEDFWVATEMECKIYCKRCWLKIKGILFETVMLGMKGT